MPEQIIEDSWELGWIPSNSQQADFGQASRGLLRMDNLTLDERGSIRLINQANPEVGAALGYQINSIFGTFINNSKLRYLYDAIGNLHRNYGAATSQSIYDVLLGAGGNSQKAGFLNALGHVISVAGTLQIKDRGDISWPLQIPQPAAPVLSNLSVNEISLSNLDGSGNYTNWTSSSHTSFTNTGSIIVMTAAANNLGIVQTVYASLIDTTNFGVGTGFDTPSDLFQFNFEITDPTAFTNFTVEFLLTDPGAGPVSDYYYVTLVIPNIVPPSTLISLNFTRGECTRAGSNSALDWSTVKGLQFSFTTNGISVPTVEVGFFEVGSAASQGSNSYICVELNDTGQFLQFSVGSTPVSINSALNYIKVDRSGTPCNSQCNNIRFYREDAVTGQYLEVNRQTGAYGFTPASFTDSISDDTAIQNAALDTTKILQFFRAQLPTNIIGMIYYASRVIYLTTNSFFPSFQLDFGTYDSRFNYELTGTNSELCLFITKLSIGIFIVATTVDFYQITGDFSLTATNNPDGTQTVLQNVVIQPLGISDPAISREFAEVEGNIYYMSARGPRSMSNGSSVLLNTTTDLLFRNEARFGFNPVSLQPNDLSQMGIVSSGTRIYFAIPLTSGNVILVSTYNPPLPAELRGSNYWRPIIIPALCLCKELDGTVIYGDTLGNVGSLENAFVGTIPIFFQTQYNYGQHPSQTKTVGGLLLFINTGGAVLTLTINGLKEDGTILTFTTAITSNGLQVIAVDPHSKLIDCIAYQLQITGNTPIFELGYTILITVQEYPPKTFYALIPFSNLGKDTLKKLSKWGFVIDTLGNEVTVQVTADNKVVTSQIDESPEPQGISTEFWFNNEDLAGLDWQIELIAPLGMHLFKFMNPDILQVYPPGRLFDQVGPLDLDREGIVFAFRIRMINEGVTFHYEVLDNDVVAWSDDVVTIANADTTYEITLPKGINTSVCRLLITAPTIFYRFYVEFKLRTTGKETDNKWVKVSNNAN